MIVRNIPSWFRLLFVWHGSVLPRILPRLLLVLAVAVAAASIRHWWLASLRESSLGIPTFTLLGVSLAIFLGFRNSVSYDRFWEARKLWGSLLIASRSLSRQMLAVLGDDADSRRFVDAICAFAYALKAQLRGDDADAHLQRLLPAEERERIMAGSFRPALILAWLGREAQWLQRAGRLSELQWHALDRNLNTLSEILGGCERIATTPMPFTYRVLLNRTVTIYCLLLPAGLASSIGWLTPPIAVFIAYTYFALEQIAEELEEPFGTEGNDLPLSTLCHTIESSLREMQGLPLEAPPPPRRGIYLH
ncbi:bestrophin family protein [Chromobacterium violaceum]|uniref:bestrophin family protein n=1 Tax=Chromobacterium violaceum TaxID=536 RepID=UPI001CE1280F|nr:bestrophin family ion channel [Chromobacterium violaceum]